MNRISCAATVLIAQLALASTAMGATITITPPSGPVGTVVTLQGEAAECSEETAEDAEVFLVAEPETVSEASTPRALVEVDDAGAFARAWTMPVPAEASDDDDHDHATASVQLGVRCIDASGAPELANITPAPATFTYTFGGESLPGPGSMPVVPDVPVAPVVPGAPTLSAALPAECASLGGLRATPPIDVLLQGVDACLQAVLRGTGLSNTLFGDALANVIEGLGGDDLLRGRGGDDVIRGGRGDDRMFGDAGSDALVGGAGHDAMRGGPGSDTINANDMASGDVINGGPGTDTCTGNPGDILRACERIRMRRRG